MPSRKPFGFAFFLPFFNFPFSNPFLYFLIIKLWSFCPSLSTVFSHSKHINIHHHFIHAHISNRSFSTIYNRNTTHQIWKTLIFFFYPPLQPTNHRFQVISRKQHNTEIQLIKYEKHQFFFSHPPSPPPWIFRVYSLTGQGNRVSVGFRRSGVASLLELWSVIMWFFMSTLHGCSFIEGWRLSQKLLSTL